MSQRRSVSNTVTGIVFLLAAACILIGLAGILIGVSKTGAPVVLGIALLCSCPFLPN